MTLEAMQRLFDFTDDDLISNRAGRLSARQQDAMRRAVRDGAANAAAALTMIPAVGLMIIAYLTIVVPLSSQIGPWTCLLIPLALVVLVAIAKGWQVIAHRLISRAMAHDGFDGWLRRRMPRAYARPLAAVEQGSVIARAGQLTLRSDGEHEHIFLGDEELQNSAAAEPDERLWQLTFDQAYIVYQVPDTEWIAAVTPDPS